MGWVGSGHTKWTRVQFHLGNFTDRHMLLDSISAFHSYVVQKLPPYGCTERQIDS